MLKTSADSPDFVIVGGGVIGLSIAYELAKFDVTVSILDAGTPGQESSWAGAGMLPPARSISTDPPDVQLRSLSHALWPEWSAELQNLTGIDNGYEISGALELGFPEQNKQLESEFQRLSNERVLIDRIVGDALWNCEPQLNRDISEGIRLAEMAQVRNPRHIRALMAGCQNKRVSIQAGTPVLGFVASKSADGIAPRILAARTPMGDVSAGQFVIAGGSWSNGLTASLGVSLPIHPVRGQIVLLSKLPLPFRHILMQGARYLVPRSDGRILVGSTEERVGFEKANTAAGVAELLEFAQKLVPSLSQARLERTWSGLRPGSPHSVPFLSRLPETQNVFVAAGHYRHGLQWSPATGHLMARLMMGRETELDMQMFSVSRYLNR